MGDDQAAAYNTTQMVGLKTEMNWPEVRKRDYDSIETHFPRLL